MGKILNTGQSSHWYDRDANPRYGAGLREARKGEFLPSVSTINNVIDKFQIGVWKQEQALISAIEAIRSFGEQDESFDYNAFDFSVENKELVFLIKNILDERLSKAANIGTEVHKSVENYLTGQPLDVSEKAETFFVSARDWIDKHFVEGKSTEGKSTEGKFEECFANIELGYAGRVDFDGKLRNMSWYDESLGDDPFDAIVDFKTQNVKKGKPVFWDEMIYQLAAYRKKDSSNPMFVPKEFGKRCVTVIISTNPEFPGATAKVWSEEPVKRAGLSVRQGWEIFSSAKNLFYNLKKL